MTKYVELQHVKELINLYKNRDSFHDWTESYAKYDRKIKNTIAWLERNAKTFEGGSQND